MNDQMSSKLVRTAEGIQAYLFFILVIFSCSFCVQCRDKLERKEQLDTLNENLAKIEKALNR